MAANSSTPTTLEQQTPETATTTVTATAAGTTTTTPPTTAVATFSVDSSGADTPTKKKRRTSLCLRPKTEACMVVIFGFLMGLIVFCCERNVYTLAWSMQSSVVSFAFTMTFSVVIPLIQVFTNDGSLWWIVYIGVGSLWLTLGILMLYKAWTKGDEEEFWALPLIGKFALKQAHKRIDKKAAQKEAKKARKSSV